MKKSIRHQLVVLPGITTSTTDIQFLRQSNIQSQNGTVIGIELFPAEKLPSYQGNVNLALADCRKGIVTLMDGNQEVLKEVPLSKFYAPDYNGILPDVDLKKVEWEKSFVRFVEAPSAAGQLILSVVYEIND
jgi:hypothetical protein